MATPDLIAPSSRPGLLARLFDRLLGPRHEDEPFAPNSAHEDPHLHNPYLLDADVRIEDTNFARAGNRALTEATAQFIREAVSPVTDEIPGKGFSVTCVRIAFDNTAAPFLATLARLDTEARNVLAVALMKKATGAERLDFRNFYGITLDAEPTVVDAELVRVLAVCGSARARISVEFDGCFADLPEDKTIVHNPAAALPASDVQAPEPEVTNVSVTPVMEHTLVAGSPIGSVEDKTAPAPPAAPHNFVARLRVRTPGGVETEQDIFEQDLPLVLGRQHPCVRPVGADESVACLVSRRHLWLDKFDPIRGQFHIRHDEHCTNLSYKNGRPLPMRFIHDCGNSWISLGAPGGEGTVQICLQRA